MTRIPVVLCLLVSVARAQSAPAETGRDKLFGKTVHADGTPWPGATVRLVFRTIPERDDFGTCDQVEVRSDADGQFKAALLPCCAYTAYASEAQAEGQVWFSAVAEGVLPATHLTLRQEPAARRPRLVKLQGDAEWRKVGQSVTLHAIAGTAVRQAIPVALDPAGLGTIPPQPGGTYGVEVLGTGGVPIVDRRISDHDQTVPTVIVVPPPLRVRATLRTEGDAATPIPGATVWTVAMGGRRAAPAGTTDAEGRCALWLPGALGAEPPGTLHTERELQADAPGYAITSRRVVEAPEENTWDAKAGVREVVLTARRGYTAAGRLVGVHGKPLAGTTLLVACWGSVRETANSRRGFQVWSRPVTTGADGSFQLGSLDPDCPFQLLADARTPGLMAQDPTFPPVPLAILARASNDADTPKLGDVGVTAAAPLRIEVHSAEGPPARNARLESPGASRSFAPTELPALHTDLRGRAALLVPAGSASLIANDGSGQARFAALSAGAKAGPPQVLNLEPASSVRGTVVDSDGKPVAGASVWVRETHTRGDIGGLSDEERSARMVFSSRGLRGESDAQGRFQLWFLPVPGTTWGIAANVRNSGRTVTSAIARIEQDSVSDLELIVPVVDKDTGEAPAAPGGGLPGAGGGLRVGPVRKDK